MGDYSWIGPVAGAIGKGINSFTAGDKANGQMQAAYAEMLRNLQERFGDYDKLGKAGYQDLLAQQVGPSALEGLQYDPAARQGELEAMAALSGLAQSGGLNLGDMQALNQVQGNLNRNNMARQQGLANQFAARGQLGAGAQMAMALQGQSDAAMGANQRAESVAAQAQARAMQALLEKGRMGAHMGDADWKRKAMAAQARDAIEARNAAARTDAGKYNNSLRGQAFEDELSKARGKTQLTGDMNKAVFGRGQQSANTTLGQAGGINSAIDSGVAAFGNKGNGGGSSGGDTGNTGTLENEQTDADLWEEEDVEGGGDD